MATSVTQHQITFTFDSDYTVGTYLNGDYYVVAPSGLQITSTSPSQSSGRNGIMVNPVTQSQGFDNTADNYDSALNVTLPYTASVGDSIIVATSDGSYVGTPDVRYDTLDRSVIETIAVLTVVSSAPSSPSFRPPYCGTTKTEYLESSVNLSLLPNLSSTSVTNIPTLADQVRRFERTQLDYIYNPNGQSSRPTQHMEAYGGFMVQSIGEAFSRLALDDGTTALKPLAYGLIQYGIDLFGAQTQGNTKWPVNGGHNHGRKPVMTLAAVLLNNTEMKNQIKSWSDLSVSDNDDIFQDDWSWRYSEVAKTPIYGGTGTESEYWEVQLTGNGNKAAEDPYGYIDGGPSPGSSYQAIVDPPSLAWSLMGKNLAGFSEVWNNPSIDRGSRVYHFGAFALPDPYQSLGSGTKNGIGRYPSRHGNNYFNSAYNSAFTSSVFNVHTNETVFMPDISPYQTSAAVSATITLTQFGREAVSGYPNFWDVYDNADPPEHVPGVYPYLTGTTIYYTIDGTEPTTSSSVYSSPFQVTHSNVDSSGKVVIKAFATKSGYDNSAVNTARITINQFIKQAVVSNSEGSSVTSKTATWGSTETAGNIVVAAASVRSRSSTISFDGDGWIYLLQRNTAPSISIAYRDSINGKSSVTASFSDSGQRMSIGAYEVSGVFGIFDTVVSSIVTSQTVSSGTLSTLPNNEDYPALAIWSGADNDPYPGTISYSNGFADVPSGVTNPSSSFRARTIGAYAQLPAGTTSPETTLTFSDAASFQGQGSLIIFQYTGGSLTKSSSGLSAALLS